MHAACRYFNKSVCLRAVKILHFLLSPRHIILLVTAKDNVVGTKCYHSQKQTLVLIVEAG